MTFTEKQREIVARKLGYDGPMQGFDDFLTSSPSTESKYTALSNKFTQRMAKGGVVRKKYADGGVVTNGVITTTPSTTDTTVGAPNIPGATGYTAAQTVAPVGVVATQAAPIKEVTAIKNTAITQAAPPPTVVATKAGTVSSLADVEAAQKKIVAETGTVSEGAKAVAAQGALSKEAIAATQKVGGEYIERVAGQTRDTQLDEMIKPVTEAPTIGVAAGQAKAPEKVAAAQGVVQQNELVKAEQVAEQDMVQGKAITAEGLAPEAVVTAALGKFTVDDGTLAQAAQGEVNALATVQGQLAELMKGFEGGASPIWAVGALRTANAAMASRGLGGSSMAGAAIFQAAMETTLPIALNDAQVFQQMGITNLNNRQQVALANAAAAQNLSLANLSNEQQARLANATNSFALQSQNLSNMQQTMLANTQIRATLQGQNLSNRQQAAVVNAARYAESANINLNNLQQAALHNSSMATQVDIANASNQTQAAIAAAQVNGALQGKVLDNRQEAAVKNAARISENYNKTFDSKQEAALHNSDLMKTVGTANLTAATSATIANAAAAATMDVANLNNRQQASVENARAFLQTDLKNLDNKQQMAYLKGQQVVQAILDDTSAANAALRTNATNETEVSKVNATLVAAADQFNAMEKNMMAKADTEAANEASRFNADAANKREEFNANMATQVNIANSKILAEVSTANTAAVNAANAVNAKNATDLSAAAYAQQSQTYRDLLEMSWKTGESEKDRVMELAKSTLVANATINASRNTATATAASSIGGAVVTALGNDNLWNAAANVLNRVFGSTTTTG